MKALTTCIATIAVGSLAVPALAARSHHSPSTSAITPPPGSVIKGIGAATAYSTGFNSDEGYVADAPIDGQVGWTQFAVSTTQPTISAENPGEGDQHLRVAIDPAVDQGSLMGGFSPNLALGATPENTTSTLSVMVSISDLGGADYAVVPQSPDQEQLAARVIFDFQGSMVVLDDTGGGLAFVDTLYDYPVGSYFQLTIALDNTLNTIDYYINETPALAGGKGDLVYSSVAGVIAATSFDQVVLFSDNFHITDSGDFDDLLLENSFEAACTPTDGDTNDDGFVDFVDLLNVLSNWGPCVASPCQGDVDCNGTVEFVDLLTVLSNWNPAP